MKIQQNKSNICFDNQSGGKRVREVPHFKFDKLTKEWTFEMPEG